MTGVIALVVLWAALGGAWRRMLGGWLDLPRAFVYALSLPLALPAGLILNRFLWWPYSLLGQVVIGGILLVFFVRSLAPKSTYDGTGSLKRYGPFGLGYYWAEKHWPVEWERHCGWTEFGEGFLGGSVYLCVGLFWLAVV
jgi:hypothetical protein